MDAPPRENLAPADDSCEAVTSSAELVQLVPHHVALLLQLAHAAFETLAHERASFSLEQVASALDLGLELLEPALVVQDLLLLRRPGRSRGTRLRGRRSRRARGR